MMRRKGEASEALITSSQAGSAPALAHLREVREEALRVRVRDAAARVLDRHLDDDDSRAARGVHGDGSGVDEAEEAGRVDRADGALRGWRRERGRAQA